MMIRSAIRVVSAAALIGLTGCGGGRERNLIRTLAQSQGQDRGRAAELLVQRAEANELDHDAAMQVLDILIPRLRQMAEEQKQAPGGTHGVFRAEMALAWQLILRRLVAREQSLALLAALDPVWCQYEPDPTDPCRFGVHGNLMAPPSGLVVRRSVRALAVDGQPARQKILEGVISANGRGGITWGYEDFVDLQPAPSESLTVEMKTTWYSVAPAAISHLPVGATKPGEVDKFSAIVGAKSAKKLVEHSASATLSEESGWKEYL